MALERIGSHFLHPDRMLHGRPTCTVELLYCRNPSPGFDEASARQRVSAARAKGDVDVWLRVDYMPGQTLPPTGDEEALMEYLWFLQRAVTDGILGQVRGIIVGNEPNLADESRESQRPLTPAWVARVVYGHGREPTDTLNAYQFVTTINPRMQVLAPAVGPWNPNEAGLLVGETAYLPPDGRARLSPWERWQYELARYAYQSQAHVPTERIAFTLHTYSRVGPTGAANRGADEPLESVREGTYGAQFGTRALDDLLGAIHAAGGRGIPPPALLVAEWNCLHGRPGDPNAEIPPNNYPAGLLKRVVRYVHTKPNVLGLCSFVDQDYGGGWGFTAMTAHPDNARIAAWNADYDDLLRTGW